jgi:hypothetical protein
MCALEDYMHGTHCAFEVLEVGPVEACTSLWGLRCARYMAWHIYCSDGPLYAWLTHVAIAGLHNAACIISGARHVSGKCRRECESIVKVARVGYDFNIPEVCALVLAGRVFSMTLTCVFQVIQSSRLRDVRSMFIIQAFFVLRLYIGSVSGPGNVRRASCTRLAKRRTSEVVCIAFRLHPAFLRLEMDMRTVPQARVEWVGRIGPLLGIPLVESETSRRVGRSGACATLKVVKVTSLDV